MSKCECCNQQIEEPKYKVWDCVVYVWTKWLEFIQIINIRVDDGVVVWYNVSHYLNKEWVEMISIKGEGDLRLPTEKEIETYFRL